MASEDTRLWWPFPVVPSVQQTEDVKAKLFFLEGANLRGCRAYVDESDCGAIAPDGRECLIVWRGRQRSELLLIDAGVVQVKKMFADLSEGEAFRQASVEALAWLAAPVPTDSANFREKAADVTSRRA